MFATTVSTTPVTTTRIAGPREHLLARCVTADRSAPTRMPLKHGDAVYPSDERSKIMKSILTILLALSVMPTYAATPSTPDESCQQIREQIAAHTGLPVKPNMVLLGKVGKNMECDFTSAESYRAAWGDKPLPKDNRRDRRSKDHDD